MSWCSDESYGRSRVAGVNLREIAVATVSQETQAAVTATLRTCQGATYSLADEESSSSSSSSSESTSPLTVEFVLKESRKAATLELELAATITNAEAGEVSVTLTPDQTATPGVWLAEWNVIRDGVTIFSMPFYLFITPRLNVEDASATPTIPEIRMFLWDTSPDANQVLDDVEFSDAQILAALRMPVEEWNDTPPPVPPYRYTIATFPYRRPWLLGTIGYLYKAAANWYRRNELRYQVSGGLTLDDTNRSAQYEETGDRYLLEWKTWMERTKLNLNLQNGYGIV